MSTVVVSIALHGLIALVPVNVTGGATLTVTPGGLAGADHMAALLVNAEDLSIVPDTFEGKRCLAEHHPQLAFTIPTDSTLACRNAGCRILPATPATPLQCSCVPRSRRIWLTPDSSPPPQQFPAVPSTEIPSDKNPGFSYVANVASAKLRLDPKVLNDSPPSLAARMVFPLGTLLACDLATRPRDKENSNVHSLSFRPLHELPDGGKYKSQAAAQRLVVTNRFDTSVGALTLHMSDLHGDNEVAIALPQSGTVDVELTNERDQPLSYDDPCDDGVGRDFGLVYELAANPPSWDERLLPHVTPTTAVTEEEVANPACVHHPKKGLMSRPICAMASFIQ
ncbi:MAG TPA: hypothetical protein VHG32_22800 [Thermoanaerobaculia bacterium]|nr:hypothetical protein [Thermoanaerobaculia bacterium]